MSFPRSVHAMLISLLAPLVALGVDARAESGVEGEIQPDKALVYLIQGDIKPIYGGLYDGEAFLMQVDKSSYASAYLPPGQRQIWGCSELKEMEFVAGEVYYLHCEARLSILTEEDGRALLKQLGQPTAQDSGVARKKEARAAKGFAFARKWAGRYERFEPPAVPVPRRPLDGEPAIHVPRHTRIELELREMVSSSLNSLGERIWLRVADDAAIDGQMWLRAGTPVQGILVQVERRKGPRIGHFDLVVPSVEAASGTLVPAISLVVSSARARVKAGKWAGILGGPVGALLVKGRDAFELPGRQVRAWTREDVWLEPGYAGPEEAAKTAHFVLVGAQALSDVRFDPEGRRPPSAVEFLIQTDEPLTELALVRVEDWRLPEVAKASRLIRQEGGWVATFSGWEIVRGVGLSADPVPLRFEGILASGSRIAAEASIRSRPE